MLKSLMNLLLVPVLGFALLLSMGYADILVGDPTSPLPCRDEICNKCGVVKPLPGLQWEDVVEISQLYCHGRMRGSTAYGPGYCLDDRDPELECQGCRADCGVGGSLMLPYCFCW